MIERIMPMKTEEQAKRLAKELNAMTGVWGACTDKRMVIVSYTDEAAVKVGKQKFEEIYDED